MMSEAALRRAAMVFAEQVAEATRKGVVGADRHALLRAANAVRVYAPAAAADRLLQRAAARYTADMLRDLLKRSG
jgi:hypothetical protein